MDDARVEELLTGPSGAEDDDVPAGRRVEDEAPRTETKAEKKARKREERARERFEDAHRPLDSWERYRALCDALKEANDLVDLADHKARFALVIMGALNAVMFVVAMRTPFGTAVPAGLQPWLGLGVVLYALGALYFFIEAVEALRPRRFEARPAAQDVPEEDRSQGLRFYTDILERDAAAYAAAWRDLRIGALNAEVAQQVHTVARINQAKYAALRRLFAGLKGMTVGAAVLLAIAAWFALRG